MLWPTLLHSFNVFKRKSVHHMFWKVTNLTEMCPYFEGYFQWWSLNAFLLGLLTVCTSVPFPHTPSCVAHQLATRASTKLTRETSSAPSVRRTASATARVPPSAAARLASSGPRRTPRPWLVHVSTPASFTWIWLYSQIPDGTSGTSALDYFVKLICDGQPPEPKLLNVASSPS